MVLLIIRFAIQVINLECFLLSYLGLKKLLSFHIPCPAGIMSFYADNYSTTFLFTIAIWTRRYSKGTIQCFGAPLEVLEQVAGFEPASVGWKTTMLTITLYLHGGKGYLSISSFIPRPFPFTRFDMNVSKYIILHIRHNFLHILYKWRFFAFLCISTPGRLPLMSFSQ